jgi:hypothetical protein
MGNTTRLPADYVAWQARMRGVIADPAYAVGLAALAEHLENLERTARAIDAQVEYEQLGDYYYGEDA